MSPWLTILSSLGIPCTISELIEIQAVAGNPYNPKKAGLAPRFFISSEAILSNSLVVIPGCITSNAFLTAIATILPASFIIFISALDFKEIIL